MEKGKTKSMKSVFSMAGLFALLALGVLYAAPFNSQLMGPMPEFDGVFIKLFVKSVELANLDQLKAMHDKMSAPEKAALANIFTIQKWEEVLSKSDPAKKSFLMGKFKESAGKATPADFQKNFPKILAVNASILTLDQNKAILAALDDKEMAAMSFYMDNAGLKIFFTNIPFDRHIIFLDRAPDWMLLELGLRNYAGIKTYKCKLLKQEKVGGKLQGVETIMMKYREKPRGMYMKWIDGPFKGREALYNESVSKTDLRVREGGALGIIAVTVGINSDLAKRGTNHLITEVGLKFLLEMIRKDWTKSHNIPGDLTRKNYGIQKVGPDNCYVMDSIQKNNPKQNYYCQRLRHYIDYTRSLEIQAEVFDWDGTLKEKYTYLDLQINADLKDIDFDQKNPEYALK